jgi:hypothetical protein
MCIGARQLPALTLANRTLQQVPEATQLIVEGLLMKLLAQSPVDAHPCHVFLAACLLLHRDAIFQGTTLSRVHRHRIDHPPGEQDGTLMCCANDTHLKFVDSRFLKLYETNTPGPILAACFHPQKYELFLKIDNRTLVQLLFLSRICVSLRPFSQCPARGSRLDVQPSLQPHSEARARGQIFDLATKEYRTPEESDTAIPPEPWQPPQPPPGAQLQHSHIGGGMVLSGEKRRSGSGRPKGSKDKTQRKPRSAAAQEFEKEVVHQLTTFCGEDASKWNAKKPAIDAIKASPMWEAHWTKAGLNEQQLVQFVHRLKAKRLGGKEVCTFHSHFTLFQSSAREGVHASIPRWGRSSSPFDFAESVRARTGGEQQARAGRHCRAAW